MSDLAEAIKDVVRRLDDLIRFLEGEQVLWCEEHKSPMFTHVLCDWAYIWESTPCSIVPKLLVDV